MAFIFACKFQSSHRNSAQAKKHIHDVGFGANPRMIKFPDRQLLRFIVRSLLLFIAIISLPWIGPISGSVYEYGHGYGRELAQLQLPPMDDIVFLPILFRDLANVGLIKPGDHAVLIERAYPAQINIFQEIDMEIISEMGDEKSRAIPESSLDFIFANSFTSTASFIDRTLRIGGVVTVRLSSEPSNSFRVPPNFHIVYFRKFDEATVVAMRKVSQLVHGSSMVLKRSTSRRLLASADINAKRIALKGLEDVLLEPPPKAAKLHKYLRKTKYLPDLLGDTLDEYPRRVFIDVGPLGDDSGSEWFERHYPTRNRTFEKYHVEMVATEAAMGMSEWLRTNVREEEYVVMKAESEVVEEMVANEAIFLVDELFLECKHQEKQRGKKTNKSKRAYWECLALYGKLRDEGVAVHQWWG